MSTKLEKEIIGMMDGETPFGRIGRTFGLSYQTIKLIADANGIKRPRSNSKTSKFIPKVMKMLGDGMTVKAITKKLKVSDYAVRKIAKDNDIKIPSIHISNSLYIRERNVELVNLIKEGNLTYPELAKKYNVSKQRIYQFAKLNGISRWKLSREKHARTAAAIKADYKAGLSYEEIKTKHNFDKLDLSSLKPYGFESLYKKFRETRNKQVVKEYKVKIAKEVIKSDNTAMDSPTRIISLGGVYGISTRRGFKKYPNIGNRSAGGVFENPKTIRLIKKLREKDELSFNQIADVLNSKGLKSPMGKKYTGHNLRFKYQGILKHNK